jgi:thiol:disulfide interchange protein DsbD
MVLAHGFAGAQATDEDHIRWQFSSLKQSGSEWKLVFTAVIDRGWHLYSQSTPAGGPMPVRFVFAGPNGFRFLNKVQESGVLKTGYDEVFLVDVLWYEDNVVFTRTVKVTGREGKYKVTGEIEYSVCSGEMCVPGSIRFSLDVGD